MQPQAAQVAEVLQLPEVARDQAKVLQVQVGEGMQVSKTG